MIMLENVLDVPRIFGDSHVLLEDASLVLPIGRYALLSANPEYHPALINILTGLRTPRRGFVYRTGFISWPIGRAGFVRGKLTGIQMTKFICSLYGIDYTACLNFISEIMTAPEFLQKRIAEWPSYVRLEYTFSIALVPAFDMFVIDANIPIEETRFSRLWRSVFEDRIVGNGLILSTFREDQLIDYCTKALVHEQGKFWIDDDLEACIRRYPPRQSRAEQPSGEGLDGADFGDSAEADGLL
ncbi:ATPase [Mesorhizobium sophorae]|uniref:ATPase n=1 Tax=Mesorhizobium sophorae TaxID=1300294 RepID=UPI000BA39F4C|nr:ATPase [Mesorhizobium sophorae]